MGDGFASFEINEDDLAEAYDPFNRKRRRTTKHQQIYGVFADDDDDEMEDGDGEKDAFRQRKRKDYTAPMNFISGGIKQGDKMEASSSKNEEKNYEEDEEDDDKPGTSKSRPKQRQLYSSFSKNKKSNFDDVSNFAGIRNFANSGIGGGKWEKHTKGIGAKLLSKMGHQPGKGLGKSGQGIAEPIETALRPGRGAIGAYGPEATGARKEEKKILKKSRTKGSEEEGEESGGEISTQRKAGWKKDGGRQQATKPKIRYRTLDEVVAEGGDIKSQLVGDRSTIKVIDMTGKEQRVYTGYEAIRYATSKNVGDDGFEDDGAGEMEKETAERVFDVPELRHNLDLLLNMTEDAILRNDRQLKFLKDQKVALVQEEKQLTENLDTEDQQLIRLRSLFQIIEKFEEKSSSGNLTLDDCKVLFKKLQGDYYQEYKMYGLSSIAVTSVLPIIKNHFQNWKPLEDPEYGYEMMREWRTILAEDQGGDAWSKATNMDSMHPYHRLVWDAWMPVVRRCVLNWEPKVSCDDMINVVTQWSPMLPAWVLENVLEQIIFPCLQREVDNWNPMTDTTPIHFWLHPWLPLMGDRLQPVYAPIRHKLGRALSQWHPSDPSAKNVLRPWKDVFTAGAMQNFLSQYILPKLEQCLAELVVNPANQDLHPWRWVMDWLDMINPALIANALLQNFFPKWHHTLITWLSCGTANYNEISQWYTGWKSLFSSDLMAFKVIRDQFTHALEVMNQAVSGGGLPAYNTSTSSYVQPGSEQRQRLASEMHQKHMEFLATKNGGSSVPVNFKDLVERKAEEHGLLFMPVPNKYREGKPVYKFGPCQVYVDRNVVFLLQPDGNQWIPVSLEQLVSSAASK